MKKHYLLLTIGLLFSTLFVLSSCKKEEENGIVPGSDEINFYAEISAPKSDTRMKEMNDGKYQFVAGDEIGIFAVVRKGTTSQRPESDNNYIHNVKLTYDGAKWTSDTKLFYPKGVKMDVYAYYPYSEAATNPSAIPYTVPADQSTKEKRDAAIFMRARAENVGEKELVKFNFTFAMTLVKINIEGLSDPTAVTPKLTGFKTKFSYDLGRTSLKVEDESQDITMRDISYHDNDNNRVCVFEAFVPAQVMKTGSLVYTIEHANETMQKQYLKEEVVYGATQIVEEKMPYDNTSIITIPDETFKALLLSGRDLNNDGELSAYEAGKVTKLYITKNSALKSLEGLESLPNMTTLELINVTNVETVDLSNAPKIRTLQIHDSGVKTVVVKNSTTLNRIAIKNTPVEDIDFTGCVNATDINLSGISALKNVDFSPVKALKWIEVINCSNVETVKMDGLKDLSLLKIYGTPKVTSVDLSTACAVSKKLTYTWIDLTAEAGKTITVKHKKEHEIILASINPVNNPYTTGATVEKVE